VTDKNFLKLAATKNNGGNNGPDCDTPKSKKGSKSARKWKMQKRGNLLEQQDAKARSRQKQERGKRIKQHT